MMPRNHKGYYPNKTMWNNFEATQRCLLFRSTWSPFSSCFLVLLCPFSLLFCAWTNNEYCHCDIGIVPGLWFDVFVCFAVAYVLRYVITIHKYVRPVKRLDVCYMYGVVYTYVVTIPLYMLHTYSSPGQCIPFTRIQTVKQSSWWNYRGVTRGLQWVLYLNTGSLKYIWCPTLRNEVAKEYI